MTPETLTKAIREAKRFISIAQKVEINSFESVVDSGKTHTYVVVGKQTGATKRASMDLTRALAEMRKP